MSGTWATDWATNDVVTAAEFRKSVGCVADSTLGISAASIDFSGLPTTYAHLLLELYLRSDVAAATDNALLRFNGDTGANYDYESISASAASVTTSETFAASSLFVGVIPANTAGANLFGIIRVEVQNYANAANNKAVIAQGLGKTGTASGNLFLRVNGGAWRSSAAINRVTLLCAGNFVAGSRASVYVLGS